MRNVVSVGSLLCVLLLAPAAAAQPQPNPPAPPAAPEAPPAPPPAPPPSEPVAPAAELPPGHPPVAKPALPPGHPPVAKPALPPGHPPVAKPALPPGHPPVGPTKSQPPAKSELPPVPLGPPRLFPVRLEDEHELPLVGIHGGRVFIRDADDSMRFYPGGRMRTDLYAPLGAPDLAAANGGNALNPSFAVRRVRLDFSGELFKRLAFTVGVELGGGRIGASGYAGPGTSRFAMSTAHDGNVRPAEASVSYKFRRWLNFTAGQFNVPYSMANRTREDVTPFMERNVAIRGLIVPYNKDIGLSVWGELLDERMLNYELGVFGGDGPNRPFVDARPDLVGRIYARPLAGLGDSTFLNLAQIGLSMKYGERDQAHVDYDFPTIATNQGFVMWQPGYVDSVDRLTHVLPSGAQAAIGGELRLPFDLPHGALDIRAEAHYVAYNTREAVDGFQQTNTERFGRVNGLGWYAQVSYWALGDAFVNGEPGVFRPVTVDLKHEAPTLRGLEILLQAAGVSANYSGATRQESQADPLTPVSNIALYQFGGGLQFWYSRNFRAALNYMMYFAPDSGDPLRNQAFVPDNLVVVDGARNGGNTHHELGGRLAVGF